MRQKEQNMPVLTWFNWWEAEGYDLWLKEFEEMANRLFDELPYKHK